MENIDLTGREYKLIYGEDGKVTCIKLDAMSIPIAEGNRDYQEFLEWNKQQKTPLDLKSTIAVKAQAQPTQAELLSELNRLIDSAQAIETILKK